MTKPIEIGCRVLVVNDAASPSNNGKVGVVIDIADEEEWIIPKGQHCWLVKSLGDMFEVMTESPETGEIIGTDYEDVAAFDETEIIRLPDEDDVLMYDLEQSLDEKLEMAQ